MPAEYKTFKVLCKHCQQTFHVRFPLAGTDPDNPGGDSGEVVVTCLYCRQNVMIRIPRQYIADDNLLRGQ